MFPTSQSPTVRERLSDIKLASGLSRFQSYTSPRPALVTCSPIVTWHFGFSLQTDSPETHPPPWGPNSF